MTHLDLAKIFNSFSYYLEQNKNRNTNSENRFYNLTAIDLFRIVVSRLYYALYHQYLHSNLEMVESTSSNKHREIKERLQKSSNRDLSKLFFELQQLRVWADYETKPTPKFKLQIAYLLHKVNRVVNR